MPVKATRCESPATRRRSGRLGRECEALAGAFGRDDRLSVILASAALDAAAELGIGLLDILGALTGGVADFVGANHIAATNDHGPNV